MGSKTTAYANALLNLLFNNVALANIGDASGLQPSATAGSFYISLHTADPGTGGNQTTSETAYTGYARVAVARSAAGWTVTGASVANFASILFGICTASPGADITYAGIGTDSSGTGTLLYRAPLSVAITMLVGVIPEFTAGHLNGTES